MKEDLNKNKLNIFLADHLCTRTYPPGKKVFVTSQEKVKSNCEDCVMAHSDHEEADTRICVHRKEAITCGMTDIKVLSTDTDVIVLILSIYHELFFVENNLNDIVVEYGFKKIIRIKNLADSLGQTCCRALPFLHSFSGCDTISAFKFIGKKRHMKH